MAAIVAGSKVSTKLDVLNSLAGICDQLIVGGGIANTFLAAAGHKVGKSLYEADLVETAKAIAAKVKVPLPVDVVVAKEFAESAVATVKAIAEVADDDMILDIGPQTAAPAIDKYGIAERISYISTGGGAFLEFVEGKVLPAVEILEQRAKG